MPPGVQLRGGHLRDAPRLAVLATQVWLHTYCTDGISAEVADYVQSELTTPRLAQRLSDADTDVLVAERGECLVGFAVVKRGVICPCGGRSSVELQTLYVQAHFLGGGIGRALLAAAAAKAREHGMAPLWLAVNARNTRAIGFYASQGFSQVGTTWFVLGEGRHENHVLVGGDA